MKNIFVMSILVVSVALIFLGSVSAADNNSAIGTEGEISQDLHIVIDEVNIDDAECSDGFHVSPIGEDYILPKTAPLQNITPVLDDESHGTKCPVYITLDCNYGVENSTVKITPTVLENKYDGDKVITGGGLKIYSDSLRNNLIASVNLNIEDSFYYKVPECPDYLSSKSIPLFYTYDKYDYETNIFYHSESSLKFISMNTNNFIISVKDSKGRESQNDTIKITEGEPLYFTIEDLDFKYGSSHIIVKVDGVNNNRSFMQELNFDYMTHKILFDDATLPLGEYVISAFCQENVGDNYYFAGTESNTIYVKVIHDIGIFEILKGLMDAIKNIEVPA